MGSWIWAVNIVPVLTHTNSCRTILLFPVLLIDFLLENALLNKKKLILYFNFA